MVETSEVQEFLIATKHSHSYAEHVAQTARWLRASGEGAHTAAISYAALELRFAIERFCLEMLIASGGPDLKLIEKTLSFAFVRGEIYRVVGNQRVINRRFDFVRVLLRLLGVQRPIPTPNIGYLHRLWGECSELLHATWPVLSTSESDLRAQAFSFLREAVAYFQPFIEELKWPVLATEALVDLARTYVSGEMTDEDLEQKARELGIYAVAKERNSPAQFLGKAVPPAAAAPPSEEA